MSIEYFSEDALSCWRIRKANFLHVFGFRRSSALVIGRKAILAFFIGYGYYRTEGANVKFTITKAKQEPGKNPKIYKLSKMLPYQYRK